MLGVASLVSMMGVMNGFRQGFIEYSNAQGGNNRVSIYNLNEQQKADLSRRYRVKGITIEDMHVLVNEHGDLIESIVPQLTVDHVNIRRKNRAIGVWQYNAVGVNPDFPKVDMLEVASGRNLAPLDDVNRSRVCVIGSIIQSELFDDYESPLGEKILVNDIAFTVVGVFKEVKVKPMEPIGGTPRGRGRGGPGGARGAGANAAAERQPAARIKLPVRAIAQRNTGERREVHGRELWEKYGSDNALWGKNMKVAIPFTTFQTLFKSDDLVDSYELRMKSSENLAGQIAMMKASLIRAHKGAEDFTINPWSEHFEEANAQIQVMRIVFLSIAVIALIVGGIGVMNVILASISERIREIGVRKSMGARDIDIFVQFLIETTVLSLIGGFLGVWVGFLAGGLIGQFAGLRIFVSFQSVMLAVAVSSGTGILAGLYPSFKASRLNPIDALRYE
jgi:putative ABC transport system permease protein